MDELLAALNEKGVDASGMDEEQLRKVSKALGVDPLDYLPRKVEVVPYTNKRKQTNDFVSTDSFVVGRKEDGSALTVRGLFLRVEALDQAIEDLKVARGLVQSDDSTEE
jgi:hypothetical protein